MTPALAQEFEAWAVLVIVMMLALIAIALWRIAYLLSQTWQFRNDQASQAQAKADQVQWQLDKLGEVLGWRWRYSRTKPEGWEQDAKSRRPG